MIADTNLSDNDKANVYQSLKGAKESYLSQIGETVKQLEGVYSTYVQAGTDGPRLRIIANEEKCLETLMNVMEDTNTSLETTIKPASDETYTWYYYS